MIFILLVWMFMFLNIMLLFLIYVFMEKSLIFVLEINLWNSGLMNYNMYMYMDWMSVIFMFVVSLIVMCTFMYSEQYMKGDLNLFFFVIILTGFVLSMFLLILGLDMWFILMGWDGLGVTSYLLVAYYKSSMSYYSSMVTVITNRLGDVGLVLYCVFMLGLFGHWKFMNLLMEEKLMENLLILILLIGCFTKSAQLPFSVWLPLAMAAPTPVSALVHSSTLVTAGVYILIRFSDFMLMSSNLYKLFMYLCLITLLMASMNAAVEIDLKKIIAFSTMSQLSLMILPVLMGSSVIGFYHLLMHALYKALMFLCSGIFIHEMKNIQDIRNYGMMAKKNKLVSGVFFICSLSLMGFPYLSGFYSKDLILEFIFFLNFNIMMMLTLLMSVFFSVFYLMRLMSWLMYSENWNFKCVYETKLDMMSNSLMLCYLLILFGGSFMSWTMLDYSILFVLSYKMKIFIYLMMMMGLLMSLCLKFYINMINKYIMTMMFMVSLQGYLFNKLFNSMNFYALNSEFQLEFYLMKNVNNFFKNLYGMFTIDKFMLIYMCMMYVVWMMMFFIW
uniref:NADH:ubiquinone reductase (H(+)-translocating) n=1 Tax=Blattisocius keegani TaxID=2337216 RepID=A0A4Y5QFL4_9ACAR|nr:NADH dehydrogenase subunit 5 [Blattisocius keegani]